MKEEKTKADKPKLVQTEDGLVLANSDLTMMGDFRTLLARIKESAINGEMVVKAAKIKGSASGLTVLDATAGMGEDSFLLAAAGFTVELYEYNPTIAALLEDALKRAAREPELAMIVARMHLHKEDSVAAMKKLDYKPDVVLLDPMFPERTKSGLIKKKFQLLQQLECPCSTEEELLEAALEAKPQKIIVKRPGKGPNLAGRKPSYVVGGKTIRYDCIVL